IDALAEHTEFFRTERTASGFAAALDALASTRSDPDALERRLAAAKRQSYDRRFEELGEALDVALAARRRAKPQLNLLLIYDDESTHVGTIAEHIDAFRKYSRHAVVLMVGTDAMERPPDLDHFDAVLIHYSIRLSIADHLSAAIAEAIMEYDGPKILF